MTLLQLRDGNATFFFHPRDDRSTITMRLLLVPLRLLATPQQFAVLVNSCRLTITPIRRNGSPSIAAVTCLSRRMAPPRTSPTSKATIAPGRTMRASFVVLGPLWARRGVARVSYPGGCVFGHRPVDLHLKGLQGIGAQLDIADGYVYLRNDDTLVCLDLRRTP